MIRIALGEDVFENYIDNSQIYIDKSLFIRDVIDNANKVLLITRPRRFGKTLNMTMLRAFFDIKRKKTGEDFGKYFKNLKIWQSGEKYISHCGKYPLIFVTLKDIESDNWDDCYEGLKSKIADIYKGNREVIDILEPDEKVFFDDILYRRAVDFDFQQAIGKLSAWLEKYYGEKVILLIDEYDAPINDGYTYGYSEKAILFMKNMFSYAMKTNSSLHKAVVTGLTKIAGKSLFSKLNHFTSYNVLEKDFSEYFGFTEDEVKYAIETCSVKHSMGEISAWYNGYNFGGTTPIYNPWSIANVCAFPDKFLKAYWVNTSSDGALGVVLNNLPIASKEKLYELANGGEFDLPLKDDVTYENLKVQSDVLWSFLLYAGYLTTRKAEEDTATFFVPNYEVKKALLSTMDRWILDTTGGTEEVDIMIMAMLIGNEPLFVKKLSKFVFNAFSYFDVSKTEPEIVYHAFVLGLLSHVQNGYYFNSNPEMGEGRADILIMPKAGELSKNAVVLEFKQTVDKEKLESVAMEGLKQIKEKKYISEAQKRGATDIYIYGIGFCGREIKVIMEKV